jgi:Domain found in Dishevelled, Egl-10, and Pleckstrin (DEP)
MKIVHKPGKYLKCTTTHHYTATTTKSATSTSTSTTAVTVTNAIRRTMQNHGPKRDLFTQECLFDTARAMVMNVEVKDRKYHMKTYHNCFVGSEAIEFLMCYLQLPSSQAALKVAQRMNSQLHFCEHVTPDHDQIQDAHLFYRFTNFCPTHNFTPIQVMRAFQRGVPVQDRTYRLRTYPRVFTGQDAVDFLVRYKFAHSRQHAVEVGRQIAERYDLFVHVTGDHVLKDEYIFYRMLVPNLDRNTHVLKDAAVYRKAQEKKVVQVWLLTCTSIALAFYYYFF